jgi:hypothetical protein
MYEKLQDWFMANPIKEEMRYKKAAEDQIMFIRDVIGNLLDIRGEKKQLVISTHTSKSIVLPVYALILPGTEIIMRGNFHDWKVSISSGQDLEVNPEGLFDAGKQIAYVYCEGFEKGWVHEPYARNHKRFTVELYDKYDLYAFFLQVKNSLAKTSFKEWERLKDYSDYTIIPFLDGMESKCSLKESYNDRLQFGVDSNQYGEQGLKVYLTKEIVTKIIPYLQTYLETGKI